MNKRQLYLLFCSVLPIICCYIILCGIVGLLVSLYNLPLVVLGDLIRFSLPLLIIYLVVDISISFHQSSKIELHRLDRFTPRNLVEAKLSKLLATLRHDTNTTTQRLRFNQQEQFDHLELLAHEIKNYLTNLKAAADNSSSVPSTEIKEAVHQANYYLNLLLSDERLAFDNHDFEFQWVNLQELINEILQQNSAVFIQKQLVPNLSQLNHVQVLTDRKWLRFCLEQLLSNAIKYSTSTSEIDIFWKDNSLQIRDHGCGISHEDLPRIFENGFTGHNGHQTTLSTGMGLYLVKKVTQQLNFQVRITSILNRETTASLVFDSQNYKLTKS